MAFAKRQPAADPRCADRYDPAQLARFHDLVRLAVVDAVALLIVDRDPLIGIGFLGRFDHAAATGRVHARGLLHEDMPPPPHRPPQPPPMHARRPPAATPPPAPPQPPAPVP